MKLDSTHDAGLRSWVGSANGHPDFPIQNLPLCRFAPPDCEATRPGVAIGDAILDLVPIAPHLPASVTNTLATDRPLNDFLALGASGRIALRACLSSLLSDGSAHRPELTPHLHPSTACTLHLPVRIGNYTDFYAGIHHAMNVGRLFRPDRPLLPNYKHVPIGYHGRASSIVVSGTGLNRPSGQRPRPHGPSFGPSERLDLELEVGIWIGPGNALGVSIPIAEAAGSIAGFSVFNDWSARDLQAWEYQPLGPFLAKNFATTISPWIVTPEALAPFRTAQPTRPDADPTPLPYLLDQEDQRSGAYSIDLEMLLMTRGMRERGAKPVRIALSNTRHLYWTPAQLVTHHASNGCNLEPGDLLGTGTISAPGPGGCGSLLEATEGGERPIRLPSGEERRFLEDGDEVILRARAARDGFVSIGFGEARGIVLPAR